MATVGVLCGRMRVEEKLLVAALAEAGIVAEPVVPAGLPLPPSRSPLPLAPAFAGGPETDLLIDRFPERAAGAALISASRAIGSATIDAGLAATGDRLAVATALAAAGVARPNTHFAWSAEAALAAVAALGYPATLLPLAYRSAATPLLDIDAAEAVIEHRAVLGNGVETLALVQAGVAAGRASCFVVVDGEPVASDGSAIDRAASDEMAEANAAARNLAARAAHALGARLIGVVVAETAFGPVVWDVQPVPEFRHARPLSGRSVAEAVAAMAVRLLKAREAQRSPIGALEPRPASATTGLPTANGNANKLGDGNGNGNGNGKGFGDGNGRADAEEVRDGVALLA